MYKISKMFYVYLERKKRQKKFAPANTFLINCQENRIKSRRDGDVGYQIVKAPGLLLKKKM